MTPNRNDARLPFSFLRRVAAGYVLETANASDLVQAADALLDAGIYSQSIGELITTPLRTLRDIGHWFESALKELAVDLPSPEEAVRILVRWHLRGVIEGREPLRRAIENLYVELHDLLTFDRRFRKLKSELNLIYCWDRYDMFALVEEGYISREEAERQAMEWDIQILERARSWLHENAARIFNSHWLSWNGGILRKIAHSIAEERAWDRLPILADALEEAGRGTVELVEHCRAGERHTECCWVTDVLLLEAPRFASL